MKVVKALAVPVIAPYIVVNDGKLTVANAAAEVDVSPVANTSAGKDKVVNEGAEVNVIAPAITISEFKDKLDNKGEFTKICPE